MDRKPFEIIAECEMPAFPTEADVARVGERIEAARGARPGVVQATVTPPVIYRDGHYVVQARLIAWAEDAPRAIQAVEGLLADAGVRCRTVLPSARALREADIPPPPAPVGTAPAAASRGRQRAAARRTRRAPAPRALARQVKSAAKRKAG